MIEETNPYKKGGDESPYKSTSPAFNRVRYDELTARLDTKSCDHCKPDGRVFHEKGKPCPHLSLENDTAQATPTKDS